MLKCVNIEELICEKTLDMMEERPFYKIKVSDLTNYAKIGRSTFYLHFDSIYDVVEKMETDFIDGLIDGFTPGASYMIQQAWAGNDTESYDSQAISEIKENSKYIRAHNREFALLLGPNGDPSFSIKLSKRMYTYMDHVLSSTGIKQLETKKKNLIYEYMINGTLAYHRYVSVHNDQYTDEEISKLFWQIFKSFQSLIKNLAKEE